MIDRRLVLANYHPLHILIFNQIVCKDIEPLVFRYIHPTFDIEEILLAVHIALGIRTTLAVIGRPEARRDIPIPVLSCIETNAGVLAPTRPIQRDGCLLFTRSFPDDVDDAAESFRAVERACRAAHDLNTFDIVYIDALKLIKVHSRACVLCTHAPPVYENQRLVRLHPANGNSIANHGIFLNIHPDGKLQRLRYGFRAHLVNVLARDDFDGAGRFFDFLLRPRCRDDDFARLDLRRLLLFLRRLHGDAHGGEDSCRQQQALLLRDLFQHCSISLSLYSYEIYRYKGRKGA